MAQHLGEVNQLIFDRPAPVELYTLLIAILNNITDIQWGWKATRYSVKYITSIEFPIKIGARYIDTGAELSEVTTKLPKLDIFIINKSPEAFASKNMWAEAIIVEIRPQLLGHTGRIDDEPARTAVIDKLTSRQPRGEYAVMLAEAIKSPAPDDETIKTYDVWLDDCLRNQEKK